MTKRSHPIENIEDLPSKYKKSRKDDNEVDNEDDNEVAVPCYHNLSETLKSDGVIVVLPDYTNTSLQYGDNVELLQKEFDDTLNSFPEFRQDSKEIQHDRRYVLGGFAALGNPSSFHNPFVRSVRLTLHKLLLPLFSNMCPDKTWRLEQLVDRMLCRPKKASPSPETWHRDHAPSAKDQDLIFGGWINFDDTPQYFSCVKGTHNNHNNQNPSLTGFQTISKGAHEQLNTLRTIISIPPMAILIFYENLIHEVVSKRLPYISRRLFLGWRLTTSKEPLGGKKNIRQRIQKQATMTLKSNQEPPMYATLHWTNHRDTILQPWSKHVFSNKAKGLTEERIIQYGPNKGKTYNIVKRVMPSLADMELPLYPQYQPEEQRILEPHTTWTFGKLHHD